MRIADIARAVEVEQPAVAKFEDPGMAACPGEVKDQSSKPVRLTSQGLAADDLCGAEAGV